MEAKQTRKINCIVCPLSCVGQVILENGAITGVSGFTCERGMKYGREEVTAPKRVLTTTVKVLGGELPLLPVVSRTPLPKEQVVACARKLACLTVKAPVTEGSVVCPDILGLGIDIVASRELRAARA